MSTTDYPPAEFDPRGALFAAFEAEVGGLYSHLVSAVVEGEDANESLSHFKRGYELVLSSLQEALSVTKEIGWPS